MNKENKNIEVDNLNKKFSFIFKIMSLIAIIITLGVNSFLNKYMIDNASTLIKVNFCIVLVFIPILIYLITYLIYKIKLDNILGLND